MLTYRLLANCFLVHDVRAKLFDLAPLFLESAARIFEGSNKNTRLAIATVFLKYDRIHYVLPDIPLVSAA